MSVKITDLGPIVLPLTGTEQLEIVDVDGESRRVSSSDLSIPAGLQATFVTLTANVDLPNERILTAGVGISIIDGGAGGLLTISGDVPPAGDLPLGTANGEMLYNDFTGTQWLATGDVSFDMVNRRLTLTNDSVVGPTLQFNLGANPSAAIQINSTLATQYTVLALRDQLGANGFDINHDYSLSAGNHRLNFSSQLSGLLLQLEADGVVRILPFAGSPFEVSSVGGIERVFVQNSATLMVEEISSALSDQAGYGQFWVRDDAPNVPMFTDDAGTDFVLNAGGGGGQVNSVVGGTNISVNVGDPVNPIVNLDAALLGVSVNGVTLSAAGLATNFLNEAGVYSAPVSAGAQISGVPINNQLAVWVNATDVEGESELTYDDGVLELTYPGVGTSINLDANNGNAIITLDGEEAGSGSVGFRLTSSDVGNGSVLFNLNANAGVFSIQQRNTSGTVLEDTWISMDRNAAVSFFFNGVESLRTSDNVGIDVGMGAEVLSGAGNFEPVGMNVLPVNVQNAAFIFGVSTVGDMIIHDEVTPRTYSLLNIPATKIGSMWSVINDAGAGNLLFQAGAGVIITFWNGTIWVTTLVAGFVTAGQGQFTVWKRADTEYYLSGPNLV